MGDLSTGARGWYEDTQEAKLYPGDCRAGDEAFSSSFWGYFCFSAYFGPYSGSPRMSEKTVAIKTSLSPWQSSDL